MKACERCGLSMPSGDGLCEDCEREFEEKVALLQEWCTEVTNKRAEQMLAEIDSVAPVELGEHDVVLLGFEGQVDAVIPLREPRPWVFVRPLRLSLREMIRYDPGPVTKPEPMKVAEYRRVGESTYQRES